MCKNPIIFILLFSLVFLLLFPGCQPSTTPGLTAGTISGQAALPGSSSKDITGYTPIPGATVTIIDAQGNTHTTLTDSNGFYSFDNIPVKANTIIYITKDATGGGKIVFMEVIPQALSPEENFYAGIADAESTSLALVIEALINLGQLQEEINLEEIISAPGFAQLEEAVRQAQENNQDILTLSFIITQAEAIADYIVNPPSAPTPPVPSSAKEILTYGFEASKNAALSSDVVGTIDSSGHTVSLTVPYSTDLTSLIATFTLAAEATAKVGATSQATGITPNDFTFPVTYTITAEDNSNQDWIVTVSIAQPIRYVATTGDNTNDGSEASPWETIQYALDNIPSSGTIIAKDGTYNESITFPSFPSGKVITLKSVNGASSATIIGVDASPTVTYSYSLEGTTLEGFTITHDTGESGRGIYTSGPSFLTIKNCTISNNDTDEHGGGIYNASDGTLTITDSTISGNTATYYGGGIDNHGTLTITGSTISGNTVTYRGGGIYNRSTSTITSSTISGNTATYGGGIDNAGTLTITGSTISGNNADDDGGGIYNQGTLTITGSTISGNTANNYGGGICNHYGTIDITSSDISGNTATYRGGGILNNGTLTITSSTTISGNIANYGGGILNKGTLTITSSTTISGNTANDYGGGIDNYSGTLTITSSTISCNTADYGGGIYIYDSSPTIQNNTISGNTASVSGGGIHIESGSPTIGGADGSDTGNFNTICGNTPDQIDPDTYPNNYISTNCDVIGETGPAGGWIFYDKGYYSSGWRYLEAAPSNQSACASWGSYETLIGETETGIGTGQNNTNIIVTWLDNNTDDIYGDVTYKTDRAAYLCDALVTNEVGYAVCDDWFLPSKEELNLMYTNLKVAGVGGFSDDEPMCYWSSSEDDANHAWLQDFFNGYQDSIDKYFGNRVRAVRAF